MVIQYMRCWQQAESAAEVVKVLTLLQDLLKFARQHAAIPIDFRSNPPQTRKPAQEEL